MRIACQELISDIYRVRHNLDNIDYDAYFETLESLNLSFPANLDDALKNIAMFRDDSVVAIEGAANAVSRLILRIAQGKWAFDSEVEVANRLDDFREMLADIGAHRERADAAMEYLIAHIEEGRMK